MGDGVVGLDIDRVAEILVTRRGTAPGRRGSGYLLSSAIVLTAAHVVRDAAAIQVRFNADRPQEKTLEATVAWIDSDPRVDMALIAMTGTSGSPLEPVRFGRVPEQDADLPCSAVGFPRFKLRADSSRGPDGRAPSRYRDSCHVRGRIPLLANRREGTLDMHVPAPSTDGQADDSPWEGMSGALVWSGNHVVGVVTEHHRSDGPGRLAVSRADRWHEHLDTSRSTELAVLSGLPRDPVELDTVAPPASAPGQATAPGRRLTMAPPATREVVPRRSLTARLLSLLTTPGPDQQGAVIALQGAGGFGKTTLAADVCRRPEITAAFPAGVLWITVGERLADEELAAEINDLCETVSGRRPAFVNPERAGQHLAELVGQRRCLLVVDDIWHRSQLRPFLHGAPNCTRLVTTRVTGTLPDSATCMTLDVMDRNEARQLLTRDVPALHSAQADRLGTLTGRWPVLLALVGRALRRAVRDGVPVEQASTRIERRLRHVGPTALDMRRPEDRDQAVTATVEASLALLTPDRLARYLELAIFPEDVEIPLAVLETYWGATGKLGEFAVEQLCEELGDLFLVTCSYQDEPTLRLHDVLRTYLRARIGAAGLITLNQAFLDIARRTVAPARHPAPAPTPWWDLPARPEYLWRHLTHHLYEAGHREELAVLTGDLRYVCAKLERLGPVPVMADLALVEEPLHLELQRAIGRTAHLLAPTSPAHALTDILLSRLGEVAPLAALVKEFADTRTEPRLVNRWPLPDMPDPALRSVLVGHIGGIWDCSAAYDSTTVVSCGADSTLRVWDVASGKCRTVLEGHSRKINACAVAPDAGWVATASDDATVGIWDLETGQRSFLLRGHTAGLQACAAAPDGSCLVSGDASGVLRLWDAATGRQRLVITGHEGGVRTCAASPDGRWIVSGGEDRALRLWDVATGEMRAEYTDHDGGVWGCAVSPDGTWIASGDATGKVRIWDTGTGRVRQTLLGHTGAIRACSVSPDGTWLASASDDGTVRIWERATGRPRAVFQGHTGGAMSCSAGLDGTWIATGDTEGTLRIWNVDGGREQRPPSHSCGLQACSVSPDGTWLAAGDTEGGLRIWDIREERVRLDLRNHTAAIWSCPISPDGTWLASASEDDSVRLWDTATGQQLHALAHPTGVWSCAIAPDGTWLASGDARGVIRIWDRATGRLRTELHGHTAGAWGCPISPDGTWLASASDDDSVRLWDTATGQQIAVLSDGAGVWTVDIGPDGRTLASAGLDGSVRLWDVPEQRVRAVLNGHIGGVWWCRFSPDGTWLASASDDRTVRLWDTATGRPRAVLKGHMSEAWTCEPGPDGSWLASGDAGGDLRLWDTATGLPRAVLPGRRDGIWSCAPGPDDASLVTGGARGEVRLWDIATGQCRTVLHGHTRTARTCLTSTDGTWIAAVADDGTIRIWDGATALPLAGLREETEGVCACAPGPTGSHLVTGGTDGTLRVWDAATGHPYADLVTGDGAIRCCAADRGGRWLAAAGDSGRIHLWDAATQRRLPSLEGHAASVRACAADPRGDWLATADAAGGLRVWDMAAGRIRVELDGHDTAVACCAADAQGRRLASVDIAGTVRIWDAATWRCSTMMRVAEGLRACCWVGDDLCVGGAAGTYVFTYQPAGS